MQDFRHNRTLSYSHCAGITHTAEYRGYSIPSKNVDLIEKRRVALGRVSTSQATAGYSQFVLGGLPWLFAGLLWATRKSYAPPCVSVSPAD